MRRSLVMLVTILLISPALAETLPARLTADNPCANLTDMDWFGITALAVAAIFALLLLILSILVVRQWWREDDVVQMPGGETIFDIPPRREWSAPPRPLD